ncbi:2Fe-2S iron-sulfur cluster binding domain-containing protein [Burkholderia ubonensis]|uniref:2Fe-2S iron-sulfur cluster binding domain-containing protein n=1 Tax=Burkholderia ubonensis TaxID=101571 RepID=UPI0007568491|nr:2Fe-2S iron-sulfur cluster binding domain-containing protein [Burkholderia ubonensis]KVS45287.1 oxidoreductase [Burkholderia ubonensis]KVS50592.1 oxidoreductase [Burkholderia ubonensis]KVS84549.1 oxidoreductase [Burkholderia ubonensis]KVS84712.1 oxidoreductase [Burkholderia ubonensis]KVS91879.1 oxidoreductase [Burkholderia ubonensis]
MTYQIEITTRDGQPFGFACEDGQDLLTAAAEAGITLPSQCRRGSCGACHATIADGDYDLQAHSIDALPAGQPGAILMCRTTPRSDLRVVAPYDHAKVLLQPVPVRIARIAVLDTIADQTMRVELQVEPDDVNGSAVEFEAGQFAELEVPGSGVRRPFSLANTSNWEGRLEFLIRLRPDGWFSTYLRERAQPGDPLTVRAPMGGFGLFAESLRPRWFVAGGTGLAPILSMLRRMAEYQEMIDARLFFGVNRQSELFMLDALQQLQADLPQLKVDLCVWHPRDDWSGFRGTPVDALSAALAGTGVRPDIYVCGPPALVRGVQAVAVAAGVPDAQFASERFTA